MRSHDTHLGSWAEMVYGVTDEGDEYLSVVVEGLVVGHYARTSTGYLADSSIYGLREGPTLMSIVILTPSSELFCYPPIVRSALVDLHKEAV